MCNIKARGGCPYMRQWNEPRETHGTNILMICSCKILTLTKSFAEFLLLKNQTKPKKTNKQTKTHTQKPQTHTHTTRKKQNKTKNLLIPEYLFHSHILSSFYCASQMLYASAAVVDNSV